MRSTSLVLLLLAAGCAWGPPASKPRAHPPVAAAVEGLPFLADDFPLAQAQARARGVPIFVDVWAPW